MKTEVEIAEAFLLIFTKPPKVKTTPVVRFTKIPTPKNTLYHVLY